MVKYFPGSIQLINSNIMLVILLSATSIYMNSFFLMIFSITAFFITSAIIYGLFAESIMNLEKRSYIDILKDHFWNYLVVTVIINLPILLFIMLSSVFSEESLAHVSTTPVNLFKIILVISIDILTIYVIPLVFLMKKNIPTIPLGIKCLLKYYKYSLPLVGLMLFINAIKLPGNMLISYFHSNSMAAILLIGFLHNMVVACLGLIVFNTACFALLNDHFIVK